MQKIKFNKALLIVTISLILIASENSFAKNTFPQIDSMASDQATKNLLGETGDLGMIYQHMKAGNWSNAEEMLTDFKTKIKNDPSSYPEEPSHQKVDSVVRALDVEISEGSVKEVSEKNPSTKSCNDKVIEQCKSEYKNRNKFDSFDIAESRTDLDAFNSSADVLSFFNNCNCNNFNKADQESIGQFIVDSKSDYIERYKNLELKYKSLKSAEKTCGDFKICHKKKEDSEAIQTWFKSTTEELRSSEADLKNPEALKREGLAPDTKIMVAFGNECPCFVKEMGLLPHIELANSFVKKWDKEEKDNQLHQAELKKKQEAEAIEQAKVQSQEAAKRLTAKQQTEKKRATKECKLATAKSEYCNKMILIRSSERIIDHEKEVGRQSGFVNAVKLRETTSFKIRIEKEASDAQKKYKDISGETLKRNDCRIEDEGFELARLPANFGQEVKHACGSDY